MRDHRSLLSGLKNISYHRPNSKRFSSRTVCNTKEQWYRVLRSSSMRVQSGYNARPTLGLKVGRGTCQFGTSRTNADSMYNQSSCSCIQFRHGMRQARHHDVRASLTGQKLRKGLVIVLPMDTPTDVDNFLGTNSTVLSVRRGQAVLISHTTHLRPAFFVKTCQHILIRHFSTKEPPSL